MKKYALLLLFVPALMVAALFAVYVGNHTGDIDSSGNWHPPLSVQQQKAKYVRDHSCIKKTHIEAKRTMNGEGEIKISESFSAYECPDLGDPIYIDDSEVQP